MTGERGNGGVQDRKLAWRCSLACIADLLSWTLLSVQSSWQQNPIKSLSSGLPLLSDFSFGIHYCIHASNGRLFLSAGWQESPIWCKFLFPCTRFCGSLKKGPNSEIRKSLANEEWPHFAAIWRFKGDPNYLVSCLNLIVNDMRQLH